MRRLTCILAAIILSAISVPGQAHGSSDIVPADNLVTEGIPKIPASLAQAINKYKNSYGYPLAGWDPSKRELRLKVLASAEISIFRVDTPESMPKALLSIPVGGAYDVYYQPQGKYLVYNKDTGGNEFYQFYLYDIAAGE